MRALKVRAKFGEGLDEAAGERIVVERAGIPWPRSSRCRTSRRSTPDRIRQRQDEAFERLLELAKRDARNVPPTDWGLADRGLAGRRDVLPIAERHRLTAYDASYLWIAIDVDGLLATRDRQRIEAAGAERVELALD